MTYVLAFAVRSLLRQPGRAALGVLGIAAVGALLFDMLLLSRGLVISFRDLLDHIGFDVRVVATDSMPRGGPGLTGVARTAAALAALPEVAEVVPVRITDAEARAGDGTWPSVTLVGADARDRRPWTLLEGADITKDQPDAVLVSRRSATRLALAPGATLTLRTTCSHVAAAPPPVTFRVAGIADFPFDDAVQRTMATSLAGFARACGGEGRDEADLLLVAAQARHGPDAAVQAIRQASPGVHAFTNEQVVGRMQQAGFSYFRQISTVLATITLAFGFLLITVLLTISVNQRLGEIAALRALGFTRQRVVLDVLFQSVLLVGAGGLLALPLGMALSIWLDAILKTMPGIPASLHFFVFESRSLVLHVSLLALTAVAAALYPMHLVARLPIAATLRREIVS